LSITLNQKVIFFVEAVNQHVVLYILAIIFLISFGGMGLLMLHGLDESSYNSGTSIVGWVFLSVGVGSFLLIFYLNISSVAYYYESAIVKKYGSYQRATVVKVEHEIEYTSSNKDDEIYEIPSGIRCYLTLNYNMREYMGVFDLQIKDKELLIILETIEDIPVRIVKDIPEYFRIAPRKLYTELNKKI